MITVPNDKFIKGVNRHQLEVLSAFDRKDFRFYMLNWHRRARKSTLGINILAKECIKNPGSVYTYVAPTYKQAKNILWDDPDMLFSYIPDSLISRKSRQELTIEFTNSSLLRILGGDDPDKLRGINTKGILFDEWAVFTHPQTIWEEIFLPILRAAKSGNRWAMFIFTPKGQNYCYEMWLRAQNNEEWYTSELRGSKSGIIPNDEYLKMQKDMDHLLFAQEMECAFIAEEEMTFITSAMIESCKTVRVKYPYIKKLVTVDPALGGDECVLFHMENYEVKKQVIGQWTDSKYIAAEAFALSNEFKHKNVCTDYIGLGEGVHSRLVEFNMNAIPVDVRNKSNDPTCYNKKAAIWWFVRGLFLEKKIPYPEDMETRRQLSSVKFLFKGGMIACEEKSATKKRVGCSPDRADAFVQGIYTMWNDIEPEKKVDSFSLIDNNEDEWYNEVADM